MRFGIATKVLAGIAMVIIIDLKLSNIICEFILGTPVGILLLLIIFNNNLFMFLNCFIYCF